MRQFAVCCEQRRPGEGHGTDGEPRGEVPGPLLHPAGLLHPQDSQAEGQGRPAGHTAL